MLCGSTLAMVGLSWPLWVEGGDFPRVPFVRDWPGLPGAWSGALPALLVTLLGLASAGLAWRGSLAAGLVILGFAVVGDQDRLQPWAYQFGLVGLAMVVMPEARALRAARLYPIALYAYSGLSKLDASFVAELGPTFLAAALRPLGISPTGWPAGLRVAAILMMPAWEVAVAAGLASARWRRLGLAGAIAQHGALLVILGPWNLGHSANVLVWNGAMIVEDWLLFRAPAASIDPGEGVTWPGRLAGLVFRLALVVPTLERTGYVDSWPAHALYASHCERTDVYLHEDDASPRPASLLRRVGPPGLDGWRPVDLAGWSRDLRGVPVYPQARVGLGVAEFLAGAPGGVHPVRAVVRGRADVWHGRRDRVECVGLAAIRRQADRSWINAHPPQPGH